MVANLLGTSDVSRDRDAAVALQVAIAACVAPAASQARA